MTFTRHSATTWSPPELSRAVRRVLDVLRNSGFQVFVVGGAVRDGLLERPVKDFDVATDARPEQLQSLFRRVIPVGLKHGTITVLEAGECVEVTTFRSPEKNAGFADSIFEDLAGRDFTCNAIAWRPDPGCAGGRIIDPHNGLRDLRLKQLRAVGDAEARLREDPLRVMRACRFAAVLEFEVDPGLLDAMTRCSDACALCSAERLAAEIFRMLEAGKPSIGLRLMSDCGLLARVLPETASMIGQSMKSYRAEGPAALIACDAFGHCLRMIDLLPSGDVLARFSTLFPLTGKVAEIDGPGDSTGQVVKRMKRLRLGKAPVRKCTRLVKALAQPRPDAGDLPAVRRLLAWMGADLVESYADLLEAGARAFADCVTGRRAAGRARSHSGPNAWKGPGPWSPDRLYRLIDEDIRRTRELEEVFRRVIDKGDPLCLKDLAVSGDDIVSRTGITPGPVLGVVLKKLLEQVLDDPSINNRERLLELACGMTSRPGG